MQVNEIVRFMRKIEEVDLTEARLNTVERFLNS